MLMAGDNGGWHDQKRISSGDPAPSPAHPATPARSRYHRDHEGQALLACYSTLRRLLFIEAKPRHPIIIRT